MLLRALEEKRFLPLGADREVRSDFQLIAGTNRDLRAAVADGPLPRRPARAHQPVVVRAAGAARRGPKTSSRTSTTSSNGFARPHRSQVRFNAAGARRLSRASRLAPSARWPGNFRDLYASIVAWRRSPMADASPSDVVDAEIERLDAAWRPARPRCPRPRRETDDAARSWRACSAPSVLAALDRFDRVQLADVLRVCAPAARSPKPDAPLQRLPAAANHDQ